MFEKRQGLRIKVLWGPDRMPLKITEMGDVVCDNQQPFHGIISRGFLNKLNQEGLSAHFWNEKAHLLESGFKNCEETEENLVKLVQWAKECKVLSCAQSVQVACRYIEKYHSELFKDLDEVEYDLWSEKEGHTSSVWKVSFEVKGNKNSFALNIARDHEAGLELLSTSKKMEKIGLEFPDIQIARVREIKTIPFNYYGETINVVVVQNNWIDNAKEVHVLSDNVNDQKKHVLIERFLASPEKPAHITQIRGRQLNKDEVLKIKEGIEHFLATVTAVWEDVSLNINEGDVVWDGNRMFVVGLN